MTLLTTSIPANFSHEAVEQNQNNTDDILTNSVDYSLVFTVIPVYLLIISVLGIILNVFVLMVFWLHKKACTVAEIYLSNLAAADLFLMSVVPILAVIIVTNSDLLLRNTLCKLLPFFFCMNADCSVYILALVSIDRYLALVHPLTNGRMRTPFYAKLACLVVWGVCFLLNVPILKYMEIRHDPEENQTCGLNDPIPTMYLVFRGIDEFFCFIPISIIFFCTLKIIHALRKRLKRRLNTQKKEQKATILVLVVLLAFLICWVPLHVVNILDLFCTLDILNGCLNVYICQGIFICLAFSNSVLNPILYAIVGKNFRTKVKELFMQMSTNLSQSL